MKSSQTEKRIRRIYDKYAQNQEPATTASMNDIAEKCFTGEPGSLEQSTARAQCHPKGPVGYLLESVHLQAAALDRNLVIKQHNQPDIDIRGAPFQYLAILTREMAARNRTARCEEEREAYEQSSPR